MGYSVSGADLDRGGIGLELENLGHEEAHTLCKVFLVFRRPRSVDVGEGEPCRRVVILPAKTDLSAESGEGCDRLGELAGSIIEDGEELDDTALFKLVHYGEGGDLEILCELRLIE